MEVTNIQLGHLDSLIQLWQTHVPPQNVLHLPVANFQPVVLQGCFVYLRVMCFPKGTDTPQEEHITTAPCKTVKQENSSDVFKTTTSGKQFITSIIHFFISLLRFILSLPLGHWILL